MKPLIGAFCAFLASVAFLAAAVMSSVQPVRDDCGIVTGWTLPEPPDDDEIKIALRETAQTYDLAQITKDALTECAVIVKQAHDVIFTPRSLT